MTVRLFTPLAGPSGLAVQAESPMPGDMPPAPGCRVSDLSIPELVASAAGALLLALLAQRAGLRHGAARAGMN